MARGPGVRLKAPVGSRGEARGEGPAQKTQMSHLTHLSHSGSLHGQKDSFVTYL